MNADDDMRPLRVNRDRQPVHVVYGGAQLFSADTIDKIGALACSTLDASLPTAADFVDTFGLEPEQARVIRDRVRDKLARGAVEDYRIDFEDGYGVRSNADEDAHCAVVVRELARAHGTGALPAWIGIRVKPLGTSTRGRAMRTLESVTGGLAADGALPPGWTITIPKVTDVDHVAAAAAAIDDIEHRHHIEPGTIRLEIMVETPEAIIGRDGRSPLRAMVDAGGGRVRGAHFGAYDYTASCGIAASEQRMRHPACDFARHMMQAALAGTGVHLADGATAVMPVPVHRASSGAALSEQSVAANTVAMRSAWRLHFDDVRHSLSAGFYQGWDLHPAQLVSRYAAVYSFFLDGIDAAGERLRNFIERAARATLVGTAFDDAATAQGLLTFFARGVACGAITAGEAESRTGVTSTELGLRTFDAILASRAQRH